MTPTYINDVAHIGDAVIVDNISNIIEYLPHIWNDILSTNFDFFSGFNIFQTKFLKFMKNSIDNNFKYIIITNLENLYNNVTFNLNNIKIEFFNCVYNNNIFSIQIPLLDCWRIPNSPINYYFNNFYNNLSFRQYNNDLYIVSFEDFINYLKILHMPTYNICNSQQQQPHISLQIKQLFSDMIFDEKDNMSDSAFKNIMEKISVL